jgi:hypothetical protein
MFHPSRGQIKNKIIRREGRRKQIYPTRSQAGNFHPLRSQTGKLSSTGKPDGIDIETKKGGDGERARRHDRGDGALLLEGREGGRKEECDGVWCVTFSWHEQQDGDAAATEGASGHGKWRRRRRRRWRGV